MTATRALTSILLLLLAFSPLHAQQKSPQSLFEQAMAAHGKKDWAGYLAAMNELAAMRPDYPVVIFNHAGAFALNGKPAEAIARLERLVKMEVAFDLADADLDSLRKRADFKAVEKKMAALRTTRVGSSSIAFEIPAKDLITEAITYDPKTESFFVSSVRKRKILRIDRDGKITDFITRGLWGVNGLGVDSGRRILYATSSAYARSEGFEEKHTDVALYAFNLDTGLLIAKYDAPTSKKHVFDDLTVAADGIVYVSDATGSVFRLRAGRLDPFASGMRAPQGSAIGNRTLYVADYSGIIWALDFREGTLERVELPSDFAPTGIDGLEFYDNSLIAIQNGIEPNRVVRLRLDPEGRKVKTWETLERNHPRMDEPTIGVIVGSDFYFVAASQGNKFDAKKTDALQDAVILKIPLKGPAK